MSTISQPAQHAPTKNCWIQVLEALRPLLGAIAQCPVPECGDPTLDFQANDPDVPVIAESRGVSLTFRCGHGHRWSLRISSWYQPEEYRAETARKLHQKEKVWTVEDLTEAVRHAARELQSLQEQLKAARRRLSA